MIDGDALPRLDCDKDLVRGLSLFTVPRNLSHRAKKAASALGWRDFCQLQFANHFLLWFLETLDSLGTSIARMPSESPCRRLSDCLGQEAERHGIFGKDEKDKVVYHNGDDVE